MVEPIKGLIFDMDGTLIVSPLDFGAIRREIGVPAGTPVLEYLDGLPEEGQRRGHAILQRHEDEACRKSMLNDGAAELLAVLADHAIKKAIVTRNNRSSVEIVLRKHDLSFDAVVAREDAEPKPSPEPVLLAGRLLGLETPSLLFIGDYEFDRLAGQAAGVETYILTRPDTERQEGDIDSLRDVIGIVRRRAPGKANLSLNP